MNILRKIIPKFFVNIYHFLLVFISAVFYNFPSKSLFVIGVTGTSGKTTVVYLINHILEQAGYKVAMLTSQEIKIGSEKEPNLLKMTMPGRFYLQKFLSRAKKEKCDFVILEVTSEGILQSRHRFINFDVGVLTNLSPEHIERHGGFKNYKETKLSFFKYISKLKRKKIKGQIIKKSIILNLDCSDCLDFFIPDFDQKIGFGLNFNESVFKKNYDFLVKPGNYKIFPYAFQLEFVSADWRHIRISPPLIGIFNIYNVLAAISIALVLKIPIFKIKNSLENFQGVPGRFEFIRLNHRIKAIVDYAHTPKSLENVYQTIKSYFLTSDSKLICVFGAAGGGRDKWKRPALGEIADKYCGEIILTNEDPYDENPKEIIQQISQGIKRKKYFKILNRRMAIKKSLELAKENDVVIITGKGAEPYIMKAGGKKIPWDDRKIVREEYRKIIQI